jgi:N-carbamoylputrescine amidase
MSTVTVAATQMACSWDRDANVARAEKLIREAARRGANIVLIQELFETPYFCKDHATRYFDLAKPLEAHPAVEHFRGLARELGVVPPVSVFERSNNAFYNSLVMVDADGAVLGSYRKSHIPEGRDITRNSISRREIPDSRYSTRSSPNWASRSAGISGSRRQRGPWR